MTRDTYIAQKQKIEKEIQRLQKQAEALESKRRGPALASIVRAMREYNITPEEVAVAYSKKTTRSSPRKAAATPPAKAKRKVPAKFRHPETGETWSGRGKAPRWITSAEERGERRDTFLIAP